jgi:sec-independent protein translocase protein TatC
MLNRLLSRSDGERPKPDEMTLTEHLGELRTRLISCLVAFVLAAIASYVLYPRFIDFLRHPLCHADPRHCGLIITAPLDAFGFRLDAMGLGGVLIASPVILYHLWRFVTPGLKTNERRYAIPFVVASLALFAFGVFVAWLTLPHALGFLLHQGGPGITPLLQANRYLSLVLALLGIFGLTFEFPVVLVGLELAGAIRSSQLAKVRRIAIISIVVIAAVVTPSSDPFSMLALAVPLLVFYEASIIIGRLLKH